MKKIIMKIIPILLVLCLLISNLSFAIESAKQEDNNVSISTPSVKDEEQEIKMPQEKIIEKDTEKEEKAKNEKNNGISTIATAISNFKYTTLSDGTMCITDYTGTDKNVEIPSTINGKTVTKIGSSAFWYNDYITSLTIPNTVKEIGYQAFYWCYKLKSITFGTGLETIGRAAFAGIRVSGTLNIPDSVKTIGDEAFMECYELKSVKFGKNVSSIGMNVFADSTGVESFTINSSNSNFSEKDGVIFDKNKTKLVLYPPAKTGNTYTIPSTVKTIGKSSFYGARNLTNIKIPDTVTTIETNAFAEARNLSSVTLGKNVTTIADYAFNYTNIESITIPASTTKLDPIAFMAATNLKNINVDGNNKTYCSKNGVVFSKDSTKIIIYPQGKTDTNYNIPNSVKTIGESAFIDAQIQTVNIPNSVTTFEDWCFAKSKLTSVTIPKSVTKMGNGPFDTCKQLQTAKVEANIKVTPYRMFAECDKLSNVTLNDNIEELYNLTFALCTSLKQITLPKYLKRIEYGFERCSSLSKVVIPETVEYISESSFDENTVVDISKTKLQKLENGSYAIVYDAYLTGTFYYDKAKEVLDLLNQYRAEKGLTKLKMDKELFNAAMERAKETALYFDHTRPSGMSCYSACSKMESENIAAGSSTASATMNQWKNSTMGHNENMLNSRWKSVGIGCYSINGIYYWVQCFSSNAGVEQTNMPANKTEKQAVKTLDDKIDIYYRDSKDLSINKGQTKAIGKISTVNTGWELALTSLEPESFKWTSSNTKVATVNAKGEIKAVDFGTAVVKGSIGNKEISFNITVKLPFTDVNEGDYFYNAVVESYKNKIIMGTTATTFSPYGAIKRGQLVAILHRLEGYPKANANAKKFPDVNEGDTYYNAIMWASSKRVVNGFSTGKFGQYKNITRAQLATILYNYARYKNKDNNKRADLSKYKDYNDVKKYASYAEEALAWAVGNNIMKGTDSGKLDPKGIAKRGQAVIMITNYCKYAEK